MIEYRIKPKTQALVAAIESGQNGDGWRQYRRCILAARKLE